MLKRLKQLFCRHKNKKQIEEYKHLNGQTYLLSGKRCERCGKEKLQMKLIGFYSMDLEEEY